MNPRALQRLDYYVVCTCGFPLLSVTVSALAEASAAHIAFTDATGAICARGPQPQEQWRIVKYPPKR